MYVVIAGCGRVGSSLAKDLVALGHEVGIIDENPDAFELLGDDFPGLYVVGAAIDWDILREAGIERADAFVASTDGDNTNIVCAQIAQEAFGVACSVARVYDPARAELFATAGIRTICPTKDAEVLLFEAVRFCTTHEGRFAQDRSATSGVDASQATEATEPGATGAAAAGGADAEAGR